VPTQFQISDVDSYSDLRLTSEDGTNRLSLDLIRNLADALLTIRADAKPLVIRGGETFFSAGADLSEIQKLNASSAFAFAKAGQRTLVRT